MAKICPKCGNETVKVNGRTECPTYLSGCGWYERPAEIRNKRKPVERKDNS